MEENKTIKITTEDLVSDQGFAFALSELMKASVGEPAYRAVRTMRRCEEHIKNFHDMQKIMITKYVSIDESTGKHKTEITSNKETVYVFKDDESKQKYADEMKALMAVEVEIQIFPIHIDSLKTTKIKGTTIYILGEFIIGQASAPINITVPNFTLYNYNGFRSSIWKAMELSQDYQVSFRLACSMKNCDKKLKEYSIKADQISAKYFSDQENKNANSDNKTPIFKPGLSLAGYNKETEELANEEVSIEVYPVDIDLINSCSVTGDIIYGLRELVLDKINP